MTGWNIADLLETIADLRGGTPMIVTDDRSFSWTEVDHAADRVAAHLVASGVGPQERVGIVMRNSAECLVSYLACCKAAVVPFNVNFRYGPDEIEYLLDNADAKAMIVQREFVGAVSEAAARESGTITIVVVDDDPSSPGTTTAGETPWSAILSAPWPGRFHPPWGRRPDDQLFQYTGGTTGMPKAVVWRQQDLVANLAGKDAPPGDDSRGVGTDVSARLHDTPRRNASAAPLIHGTGLLSQLANLFTGGTSVILPAGRFDPAAVWSSVARNRVNVLVVVGDAFARPLADELVEHGADWDLSDLQMITSSGAMFSRQVKATLLHELPHLAILDAFGASEASGLGSSLSTADDIDGTASFRLGAAARVLLDDGRLLAPGEPGTGRIAVPGNLPLGYHKDPVKTTAAYPLIDGVRYSVPGDHVVVDETGTMTLLGRGSSLINSGGEKVYPEEVEEILKEHPSVADAACVGVPDERFGETVWAVVQPRRGSQVVTDLLNSHVRGRCAAYKAPRGYTIVDDLGRLPNGKLDRAALAATAREQAFAGQRSASADTPTSPSPEVKKIEPSR